MNFRSHERILKVPHGHHSSPRWTSSVSIEALDLDRGDSRRVVRQGQPSPGVTLNCLGRVTSENSSVSDQAPALMDLGLGLLDR